MDWLAQLCGLPQEFMCNGGAGPGGGVIQVRDTAVDVEATLGTGYALLWSNHSHARCGR